MSDHKAKQSAYLEQNEVTIWWNEVTQLNSRYFLEKTKR